MEQIFINYYKHKRYFPYKRIYCKRSSYCKYTESDRCDEYPYLDYACFGRFYSYGNYGPRACKICVRKKHPADKFIEKYGSLYSRFKYLYRRGLNTKDLPYPILSDDINIKDLMIDHSSEGGYDELKPIGENYKLYTCNTPITY